MKGRILSVKKVIYNYMHIHIVQLFFIIIEDLNSSRFFKIFLVCFCVCVVVFCCYLCCCLFVVVVFFGSKKFRKNYAAYRI